MPRALLSTFVVGYSYVEVPAGWSMFTPVFDDVASGDITLGDIVVCNASGVEFDDTTAGSGRSRGKVKVYKMDNTSGNLASSYLYTSAGYASKPASWGWGTNKGVALTSGEGVVVYNGQGAKVQFLVSGQVKLVPVLDIPAGWGIFGNNTPVDVTLGDIVLCNADGVEFDDTTAGSGRSRGKVKVYKMDNASGNLANSYLYTSAGYASKPASWGWGANKEVSVAAGEALVVYNGQGAAVKLQLPAPIK